MTFLKYISIVFVVVAAQGAFAGHEGGNGTDNSRAEDGSAWFLGEGNTIKYCLEATADFGLSQQAAGVEIRAAFSTWAQYIQDKKVNQSPFPTALTIAHKTLEMTACDGTEDLKFELGFDDDEIKKFKSKYENPTAFAERVQYDKKAGWGKGIIWVSKARVVDPNMGFPEWTDDKLLRAILLHELGHVYGVEHIQGTIMDSNLSQLLEKGDIKGSLRTRIDGARDLKFCWDCELNYSGVIGFGVGADEDVKVFSNLVGVNPKGKIVAKLIGKSLWSGAILKISDDNGSTDLPITIEPQGQSPSFESNIPIFKMVTDTMTYSQKNDARVVFGNANANGKSLNLVVEINSSSEGAIGPVILKQVKDGGAHMVFRSIVQ